MSNLNSHASLRVGGRVQSLLSDALESKMRFLKGVHHFNVMKVGEFSDFIDFRSLMSCTESADILGEDSRNNLTKWTL